MYFIVGVIYKKGKKGLNADAPAPENKGMEPYATVVG